MKKKLIAIICMILIVIMPITLAQENKTIEEAEGLLKVQIPDENFAKGQETDFIINIERYEPTVLTSGILQEQSTPVYSYLSLTRTNPFIEIQEIDGIYLTEQERSQYIQGITYKKPRIFSIDNAGVLEIRLKPIPNEKDIPDIIKTTINAKVNYKSVHSAIGEPQIKTLEETRERITQGEIPDEKYSTLSGKVYILAKNIGEKSAQFEIYDSIGKLIGKRTVALEKESSEIKVADTNTDQDYFRIRLDKIIDKSISNVKIKVNDYELTYSLGSKIANYYIAKITKNAITLKEINTKSEIIWEKGKIPYRIQKDLQSHFEAENIKITGIDQGQIPTASFKISSKNQAIKENERITNKCSLQKIERESVIVSHPPQPDKSTSKRLYLTETEELTNYLISERYEKTNYLTSQICGETIQLKSINTYKEVQITLLEGKARKTTETSFSVSIPIDKRLPKFSTNKIKRLINKTHSRIEKINSTISKLDTQVEQWSKYCLYITGVIIAGQFVGGLFGEGNKATTDITKKTATQLTDDELKKMTQTQLYPKLEIEPGKQAYSPDKKPLYYYVAHGKSAGNYYTLEAGQPKWQQSLTVIYDKSGKERYYYNQALNRFVPDQEQHKSSNVITTEIDDKQAIIITVKNPEFELPIRLRNIYKQTYKSQAGLDKGLYLVYFEDNRFELWKGKGSDLTDYGRPNKINEEPDSYITEFLKKDSSNEKRQIYRDLEVSFINKIKAAKSRAYSNIKIGQTQYSLASQKIGKQELQCTDVMGKTTCDIMFNVCDPVMCPPSRFDLGGQVEVDNVIQSGFIGSLILGIQNWFRPNVVPVCMSGILASMKNYQTHLQSYEKCLNEQLISGKDIGICDKISSIYVCEIAWKNAITLLKIANTNLLSKAEKTVSSGGGEYLSGTKKGVNDAKNTINYFTKDYATTIFAAYKGRTTQEIGTEVCRAAIAGKLPSINDIVKEISRPETPPQFTATFEEYDYSPTQQQSRYQVYFHIYAGNKKSEPKSVTYSVFLKTKGQPILEFARGIIPEGQYVDEAIDKIATSGYQEICVMMDKKQYCNFGKTVSTETGLNILNDYLSSSYAAEKIETETQCRETTTQSVAGIYVGGGITSPLYSGPSIKRVCSINNPGLGIDIENRWTKVGICGTKDGKNLGSCWAYADINNQNIVDSAKEKACEGQGLKLCEKNEYCMNGAVVPFFEGEEPGRECCQGGTCTEVFNEISDKIETAKEEYFTKQEQTIVQEVIDFADGKKAIDVLGLITPKKGSIPTANQNLNFYNLQQKKQDETSYLLSLIHIKYRDYDKAEQEIMLIRDNNLKEKVNSIIKQAKTADDTRKHTQELQRLQDQQEKKAEDIAKPIKEEPATVIKEKTIDVLVPNSDTEEFNEFSYTDKDGNTKKIYLKYLYDESLSERYDAIYGTIYIYQDAPFKKISEIHIKSKLRANIGEFVYQTDNEKYSLKLEKEEDINEFNFKGKLKIIL